MARSGRQGALAGRKGRKDLQQFGYKRPQQLQFVALCDQDDDGHRHTGEVLLIAQSLVGRDEDVELGFGKAKRFPGCVLGSDTDFLLLC